MREVTVMQYIDSGIPTGRYIITDNNDVMRQPNYFGSI